MYRPDRQRAIKQKYLRSLTGAKEPDPPRERLREMHRFAFEAYGAGGGVYALHLLCDLERVLEGEKPLNRDFEERYEKLAKKLAALSPRA